MSNKPIFWKQKNGVLISVDDMDINHLCNVLKMIIRNATNYCEYCGYIVNTKYPHHNMCPNNYINSDNYSYRQIELNGDIGHHEFESDLGPMFNDDEARGNQW